jgi:hypothetical protein
LKTLLYSGLAVGLGTLGVLAILGLSAFVLDRWLALRQADRWLLHPPEVPRDHTGRRLKERL